MGKKQKNNSAYNGAPTDKKETVYKVIPCIQSLLLSAAFSLFFMIFSAGLPFSGMPRHRFLLPVSSGLPIPKVYLHLRF